MSLYITEQEQRDFVRFRTHNRLGQDLWWTLRNRVEHIASSPGLHRPQQDTEWWFCTADRLSDAAAVYALEGSPSLGAWLRDATLSIIRRSEDDWVGPPFRDHQKKPSVGNLETAHLTRGVAAAVDLATDVFTPAEIDEIKSILCTRGLAMCRHWLDQHHHLANWRAVLSAGYTAAAAVLDDSTALKRCIDDYVLNVTIFQPDGSYGESLQYANYAALNLMLARETLIRARPDCATLLPLAPWVLLPRWMAASHLYNKPLGGTTTGNAPRAVNFNDSGAVFRPSADLLLMIANRAAGSHPVEAGLARWLFEETYVGNLPYKSCESASFGFSNDFSFLSIALLPNAAAPITPAEGGLPSLASFSCGDVIARDCWQGQTVLAVHGGGDALHAPGHLHGDLNSFILCHNRERLLVDPGHSCYRNLIHDLEGSTATHNTCTFEIAGGENQLGLQEDSPAGRTLQQSRRARAFFDPATLRPGPAADRGARRLLAESSGPVKAIGSAAAALYGPIVKQFDRYWFLCGAHVLFIVDIIETTQPVKTSWHWLLNNRDGELELKVVPPDRIVARRPRAGMKLFHLAGGNFQKPLHAFVHNAYSPSPASPGEGRSGSGTLLTWQQPKATTHTRALHAIAIDSYGAVAAWHLTRNNHQATISHANSSEDWTIDVSNPESIAIHNSNNQFQHRWNITAQ